MNYEGYRKLDDNETIKNGDIYYNNFLNQEGICYFSIGFTPCSYKPDYTFYRKATTKKGNKI